MSVLSDVYVTFVLAGFTVAVICSVAPTATTSAALRVNAGFFTVALNVNVFFTDLPAFLAVTLTIVPANDRTAMQWKYKKMEMRQRQILRNKQHKRNKKYASTKIGKRIMK